ncbi:MAG: hypothetical protein GX808_12095 [Syntrophomonadaceae bacterium]|jgi:hypothetical protein|nr:hypothetical protein [Syntrophomonadaceae bacterium]
MEIKINDYILAIITLDLKKVSGGGCPVFLAADEEELHKTSLYLAKVTGGIVHDLENGILIVCKH